MCSSVAKPNQTPVSSTLRVTVNNVAPVVEAGPDVPAGVGVPVFVHATFSDPSFPVGNTHETYTATIKWGDGTTSTGTVTLTPGSPGVPTTGTVKTKGRSVEPAYLIPPQSITKANYKLLFTSGFLKKSDVCNGDYTQYCK